MSEETPPQSPPANLDGHIVLKNVGVAIIMLVLVGWALSRPQIWQHDTIAYAQAERRRLMALPQGSKFPTLDQWRSNLSKMNQTLFYKDGVCASVAVSTGGNPPVRCLFTNGHSDASDSGDLENQALLATVPLLLKPDSKKVCVVGWGSGVTAGYALRFPIERLVCAEIEPAVLETSNLFHHVNFAPETDKRTEIIPADGRNFLLCTPENFDVIISEPSNPWQAGVCNLFTKEYFKICQDRLVDGGAFAFWCQITEMPTKNLAEILKSLNSVFPSVFVFDTGQGDICAVAFKGANKISYLDLAKALSNQQLLSYINRFQLVYPEQLISRILMCPDGLKNATKDTLQNTDDRNRLEFEIARSYETKIFREQNSRWLNANHGAIWNYIAWPPANEALNAKEYAVVANDCLARNNPQISLAWAEQSLSIKPSATAYSSLIRAALSEDKFKQASALFERSKHEFPNDAELMDLGGSLSSMQLDDLNAQTNFAKAFELNSDNPLIAYHLAQSLSTIYVGEPSLPHALASKSNAEQIITLCLKTSKIPNFVARFPGVLLLLAEAYLQKGQGKDARDLLETAVQQNIRASVGWRLLAQANQKTGQAQQEKICLEKARLFAEYEREQMMQKAAESIKTRKFSEAAGYLQSILEIAPKDQAAQLLLSQMAAQSDYGRTISAKLQAKP